MKFKILTQLSSLEGFEIKPMTVETQAEFYLHLTTTLIVAI